MPFMLKKYKTVQNKKIQLFLLQDLKLTPKFSQRLLSRKRIFKKDKITPFLINDLIKDDYIYLAIFKGITKGLKPLLEFKDFAIFDKPSKLVVHPTSKHTPYCLLDEVRYHFGENANLAHRIDSETSGLILINKTKEAEVDIKKMFAEKKYLKCYYAIVNGHLKKDETIKAPIDREGKKIGVKMAIKENGKESTTHIEPILYNERKNLTLVKAFPETGRQHQIRIHLHHIGHTIIGDPIYGVDDENAESFLNKTLSEEDRIKVTKSNRLWLHAAYLEFNYNNNVYKIFSKNNEIIEKFKSF